MPDHQTSALALMLHSSSHIHHSTSGQKVRNSIRVVYDMEVAEVVLLFIYLFIYFAVYFQHPQLSDTVTD